jgi:hypothetical protein
MAISIVMSPCPFHPSGQIPNTPPRRGFNRAPQHGAAQVNNHLWQIQ